MNISSTELINITKFVLPKLTINQVETGINSLFQDVEKDGDFAFYDGLFVLLINKKLELNEI